FLFHRYAHHRDLHSFPTRRSSDLRVAAIEAHRTPPHGPGTGLSLGTAGSRGQIASAQCGYLGERETTEHVCEHHTSLSGLQVRTPLGGRFHATALISAPIRTG